MRGVCDKCLKNKFSVFCRQCECNFCENCDLQTHPVQSPALYGHIRVSASSSLSTIIPRSPQSASSSLTFPHQSTFFSDDEDNWKSTKKKKKSEMKKNEMRKSEIRKSGLRQIPDGIVSARNPAKVTVEPFVNCREHNEEPLSYYCLECNGVCICAECAIRGKHMGHDVQTITKSYPRIRRKVEEVVDVLKTNDLRVKNIISQLNAYENKCQENAEQLKEDLHAAFETTHAMLRQREQEFISKTNRDVETIRAQLQGSIEEAQQKRRAVQDAIAVVADNLENDDEIGLLNYYGTQKDSLHDVLRNVPTGVEIPPLLRIGHLIERGGAGSGPLYDDRRIISSVGNQDYQDIHSKDAARLLSRVQREIEQIHAAFLQQMETI